MPIRRASRSAIIAEAFFSTQTFSKVPYSSRNHRIQAAAPSPILLLAQSKVNTIWRDLLHFIVEIRRHPLRSKSRITIVHQPISMCVRSFVRRTKDMPTPIIFISSRPESTNQEPPHKLIHHTTDKNSMLFALHFPGTIHPINHNLVVAHNLETTMCLHFALFTVSLPSSASSSWSSSSSSMWVGSERNPLCASANEESDSFVNNALSHFPSHFPLILSRIVVSLELIIPGISCVRSFWLEADYLRRHSTCHKWEKKVSEFQHAKTIFHCTIRLHRARACAVWHNTSFYRSWPMLNQWLHLNQRVEGTSSLKVVPHQFLLEEILTGWRPVKETLHHQNPILWARRKYWTSRRQLRATWQFYPSSSNADSISSLVSLRRSVSLEQNEADLLHGPRGHKFSKAENGNLRSSTFEAELQKKLHEMKSWRWSMRLDELCFISISNSKSSSRTSKASQGSRQWSCIGILRKISCRHATINSVCLRQIENAERMVATEGRSQAQDAWRRQRHQMLGEQQPLVQAAEREVEFVRMQLTSEFKCQQPVQGVRVAEPNWECCYSEDRLISSMTERFEGTSGNGLRALPDSQVSAASLYLDLWKATTSGFFSGRKKPNDKKWPISRRFRLQEVTPRSILVRRSRIWRYHFEHHRGMGISSRLLK